MKFLFLCLIFLINLLLTGCYPKDPTVEGATSFCPGNFWQSTEDVYVCPCDYDWEQDTDVALATLQHSQVQVADLIDVALLMNPSTQVTWAHARAAAYGVGIAESALYPNVILTDQLNYAVTEYDDGTPLPPITEPLIDNTTFSSLDFLQLVNRQNISKAKVLNTGLNRRNGNRTTANGAATNSALVVGDTAQGIGTSRTLLHDLSISYLLLDFGGRQATIEAAKQALYQSNWTHNRQIQQVIISVLQSFYAYVETSYLLKARYSDLENAKKNLESAQAQFEVGIRSKLDVLQAQTNLVNIEISIVQLTGQKEVNHGVLAHTLGLPANTPFHIPDVSHYSDADIINKKVDQLVEAGIKQRPDLAAAYALHAERKAQVTIARSEGLPTLGSLIDLQEFNDIINPSFNTHSLSGSLVVSVPIFSGFLYEYQEKQARELARAACANIRQVKINVALDVVTAYFNFKTAVQSLHHSEKYLKYSEETNEAASLTYREGVSSILDLLAAQTALANAKAQLIQARTRWAVTLSNLSFAMGTTGTEAEIKPWRIVQSLKRK